MDGDVTMKTATAILVVLGGFLFYRFLHPVTSLASGGVDSSWDDVVANRDTAEPSLVILSAQWCGACQALHSDVLSRGEIQDELHRHYNVYTVDLTRPSRIVQMHASKLGVSAIPTLIRYDANGKETDRIHGESAEALLAWLKAGE